jgi:hypothetical protein
LPTVNALVEIRGHRWVVSGVDPGPERTSTVVSLQSVEDGRYGETLDVIWEVEPGRRVLPAGSLPELERGAFDPPFRYTPTDVFETLARPELTGELRELGERLDTYRRDSVMLPRQAGLTATYNLVHDRGVGPGRGCRR